MPGTGMQKNHSLARVDVIEKRLAKRRRIEPRHIDARDNHIHLRQFRRRSIRTLCVVNGSDSRGIQSGGINLVEKSIPLMPSAAADNEDFDSRPPFQRRPPQALARTSSKKFPTARTRRA